MVQDPLPRISYENPQRDGIAQPFALYKTFSMSTFIRSPFSKSLEALKLNIPDRSVVNLFSTTSTSTTSLPTLYTHPPILPHLNLLDLSHTLISPTTLSSPVTLVSVKSLLIRLPALGHLLIDETLTPTATVLMMLGKMIAQTGSHRAKVAMKSLTREQGTAQADKSAKRNIKSIVQPIILPPYSRLKSLCVGKEKVESNREHYGSTTDFFQGYEIGLTKLNQDRRDAIELARRPDTILLRFKDDPESNEAQGAVREAWTNLGIEPCTIEHLLAEASLADSNASFKLCLALNNIQRTSSWDNVEQVWNSDYNNIESKAGEYLHPHGCGHELSAAYFK